MKNLMDFLRDDHHQFSKGELEKISDQLKPFELFQEWLNEAVAEKVHEPNAFILATTYKDQPSTRIVYLKDYLNEGLVFYTNYNSQKGHEISASNKVALQFFWNKLEQQIRIEGVVERVPESMSDAYFASRPRESQIGAWASHQSEKLENRTDLADRIKELHLKFPGEVPRPPHWGGFVVIPHLYEFWQGRPSRLHDRICFQKNGNQWVVFRKNP